MIIRRATLYEVPAILQIVRRSMELMHAAGNFQWDETYPTAATFIRDIELRQLWVADFGEDAGESILGGFAAITTQHEPEYAQVGWDVNERALIVHRLGVDLDFRGFGIASALMEEAEALAEEQGIRVLRVDTSADNAATQRLFPKLGYTFAGEVSFAFRPGVRVLCYEKRLPGA